MTREDVPSTEHKRQWRLYTTDSGGKVVKKALAELASDDAAEVYAQMREVKLLGLRLGGARHLRGRIWEVRATGADVIVRLLFAKLGRFGQVLLALDVFEKKTQKTPPAKLDLAERRLGKWEARGTATRKVRTTKKATKGKRLQES